MSSRDGPVRRSTVLYNMHVTLEQPMQIAHIRARAKLCDDAVHRVCCCELAPLSAEGAECNVWRMAASRDASSLAEALRSRGRARQSQSLPRPPPYGATLGPLVTMLKMGDRARARQKPNLEVGSKFAADL